MSKGYSQEQLKVMEGEVMTLQLLWNAHCTELLDGTEALSQHPPPAMAAFSNLLIATVCERVDSLAELVTILDGDTFLKVYSALETYGDIMFRFAQWCVQRGMLHANMLPCNCNEAEVEETITKILGEGNG